MNKITRWMLSILLAVSLIAYPLVDNSYAKTAYQKTAISGGTATALDGIDGSSLSDGDFAYVMMSDVFYTYVLNASSGASESTPDVVSPDSNAGTKRWILQKTPIQGGGTGQATAAAAFSALKQSATESATGVAELATTAEAIAGTDTSRIITPAGLAAAQAVISNPKAPSQGVAMTYAASGSTGIQVADNNNIDFGTGNFFLYWEGSLPDWTPSANREIFSKWLSNLGITFEVLTSGKIAIYRNAGGYESSTVATGFIDGTVHKICAVVTRETESTAGSIVFYADGAQLGATVTIIAGIPATISNSQPLYICGTGALRNASTTISAAVGNFAPTAAEVLDVYRNGIPSKWFDQTGVAPANQTALTAGTLITGREYRIDTYAAGDDFTNVGAASNASGVRFVATGTTPTTWTNSSSLRQIGVTFWIPPEGIQPAPGQCLDSSGNKLHAMQPASGSSLIRYKKEFEFRSTNVWTASSAAQYIGGFNQNVLTSKHMITSIVSRMTVNTDDENITIGDGSDADYYVTDVAPTAAPLIHTIAAGHNLNDGTNLKLVVTPAAEATMTIEFIVKGIILE